MHHLQHFLHRLHPCTASLQNKLQALLLTLPSSPAPHVAGVAKDAASAGVYEKPNAAFDVVSFDVVSFDVMSSTSCLSTSCLSTSCRGAVTATVVTP
uniref:Secreted protein n=1 Tax=Steinernema glaseri TaxID=37863 RepID=A0A1I7YFU9_9BILA